MYPKWHILIGAVFFLFLIPFIGALSALIVYLASVLIDFDHYTVYVYRKKGLSLKKAYNFYMKFEKYKKSGKKGIKLPLNVLHTLEFTIILGILSFFNYYILLIFVGFLFHSLVDLIYMTVKDYTGLREYFFFRWLKNRKNKNYV
ncbi:MAG: hypothetical protein ABIH72_03065 [archaeon]